MTQPSWKISRRTCLQGLGVSLALPLLDGMVHGDQKARLIKRLQMVVQIGVIAFERATRAFINQGFRHLKL